MNEEAQGRNPELSSENYKRYHLTCSGGTLQRGSLNEEDFIPNPVQFFIKLRYKTTSLSSCKISAIENTCSVFWAQLGSFCPVLAVPCNSKHPAAKTNEDRDRKLCF